MIKREGAHGEPFARHSASSHSASGAYETNSRLGAVSSEIKGLLPMACVLSLGDSEAKSRTWIAPGSWSGHFKLRRAWVAIEKRRTSNTLMIRIVAIGGGLSARSNPRINRLSGVAEARSSQGFCRKTSAVETESVNNLSFSKNKLGVRMIVLPRADAR